MQPRYVRFLLGAAILVSALIFMGQTPEEDIATGCLECATERVGLVDVYNPAPLIPAYVSFSFSGGGNYANVKVDGLGYRSFYMPKDYYTWKAYWLNPATEEVLEMDWGRIRVDVGTKAVINLKPKSFPR
jgi:hypothetical protein